jgi:FtsP/CotA-like multicopper oxidase with cupredoxin domain
MVGALLGGAPDAGAVLAARVPLPGGNPAEAVDENPDPDVFETTIVAQEATVDFGGGLLGRAVTYNGTVPGPTFRVPAGIRVIVHFRNELPLPSGIHWHGIELNNASDGSGVTQNQVPTGGEFTYAFIPPRGGVYWYHPHFAPTNVEFKGQYGLFIVEDEAERVLARAGVVPSGKRISRLVLGDTTVCKAPGFNDPFTFAPDNSGLGLVPWSGGDEPFLFGDYPGLAEPNEPRDVVRLCEVDVLDDDGNPAVGPLQAGDIPNIQPKSDCAPGQALKCRTNEGQLVLTNGAVVAPRSGTPQPAVPGPVDPDGRGIVEVHQGDGWRLQMVNTAVTRYFRLRLTDDLGNLLVLLRVGGQGGLLDRVRVEGGLIPGPLGDFDTKYSTGEIMLAPGERADVVFLVPDRPVGSVLTLWTADYSSKGAGDGNLSPVPTVPVAHFRIASDGSGRTARYALAVDDPLRVHPLVNAPTESLKDLPLDSLVPPPGIVGSQVPNIQITIPPGLDGHPAPELHHGSNDFASIPNFDVSRFALLGTLIELSWENTTSAHHPMHLHGFSFQPVELRDDQDDVVRVFDYNEFIDTFDVPAAHKIVFRVRLDDRPGPDFVSPGGGVGRWVMHCHIFYHAGIGMNGELVVLENPDLGPIDYAKVRATTLNGRAGAAPGASSHRH